MATVPRRLLARRAPWPLLLWAAGALPAAASSGSPVPPSGLWFDELQAAAAPSEALAGEVARAVAADLRQEAREDLAVGPDDELPRAVFVSASDGVESAYVGLGVARGARPAAAAALAELRPQLPPGFEARWVKVDFVEAVSAPQVLGPGGRIRLEPGLQGLAFPRSTGVALLPEEISSRSLVDDDGNVARERISRYLEVRRRECSAGLRSRLEAGSVATASFTTRSLWVEGSHVIPLFRGHRRFDDPTREELLAATVAGGEYLTRALDPDGRFVYSYRPETGTESDRYNILRHAGTVFSMLELYEVAPSSELLAAARRALRYLVDQVRPCRAGDQEHRCVVADGEVKLGGNALAAIALARYIETTGRREWLPKLLALGGWIRAVQDANGRFTVHRMDWPEGASDDFTSEYFPGEALLALGRIHALDGDPGWLDSAERGARYLIEDRDGPLPDWELGHDHWLLYALEELYRARPRARYVDHALRLAGAIVSTQNRAPEFSDWLGSYGRPPRSTPAATRSEGLCAAYRLARETGRTEAAATILTALRLGAPFQLATQLRPESTLYLADPSRAVGGVRGSLTDFEIRIDFVQHHISSLLCLREALAP